VNIGNRTRNRREALGLTQDELAREVGVTPQHVSRIESGLNAPSLDLLVKISRKLGVTADYLLTGEESPSMDVDEAIRSRAGLSPTAKRTLITLVRELEHP
jgi:transcriptional regulator with XRE-family HTH domain